MKILIFHPLEDVLGGAELVLIHTIRHYLKSPGNTVYLLGIKPLDVLKVKQFCGIDLPSDRLHSLHAPLPGFMKFFPGAFFLMKVAFLQRKAKEISSEYDLCVSTYNEIDFGVCALQYIHCPMFAPHKLLQRYKIVPETSLINRYPYLSWIYGALIKIISGNRKSRIVSNISLTNSQFMQSVVKLAYGIEPEVVYPSLMDMTKLKKPLGRPRALRIVAVGRLTSDKCMLELIDFYAALHRGVPELELAIVGKIIDQRYYDALLARARELNVTVNISTDLNNAEIQEILKTSLFYINLKPYEHFGIATLEAVAAGCLPLVHRSGGSIEIVPQSQLQFIDEHELVYKVKQLVSSESLRSKLLRRLKQDIADFTPTSFYRQLDTATMRLLNTNGVISQGALAGAVTSTDLTTIAAG